jgi:hypothetical protein
VWEKTAFVSLVPQVLVEVGISDLFQWFNVIYRHEMAVQVHELNAHLRNK